MAGTASVLRGGDGEAHGLNAILAKPVIKLANKLDVKQSSNYRRTVAKHKSKLKGVNMRDFNDLIQIIQRLTAPDGCPWDKVQTHQSIRLNMIEEAYEAVDAIDKNDRAATIEELGDILLQVVLHSDTAKRGNNFDINDVTECLCEKLVSRHSHIFGAQKADNPEEAVKNWEKEKAKEKNYTSAADQLKKLPQVFPALLRAQKIIKKSGFKPNVQEFNNLTNSLNQDNAGQFLFYACALAYEQGIDAEVELNAFNGKFIYGMAAADKTSGANASSDTGLSNGISKTNDIGKTNETGLSNDIGKTNDAAVAGNAGAPNNANRDKLNPNKNNA